ncbi:hypothetical protein BCR34DRAFT_579741, partial [Clohesyomyces aquaticus]
MFGPRRPGSLVPRPFGNSSIDGFDFDFESPTKDMVLVGERLRSRIETTTLSVGKKCLFTVALQWTEEYGEWV